MRDPLAPQAPPVCPAAACPCHTCSHGWRFVRIGCFTRLRPPRRVQRYRCCHCQRTFSEQTFRTTYWRRRPDLLLPVFQRLLACSGFRQIAREFAVSPSTIATQAARLGRHCLLFHELHRPRGPLPEPRVLDGFVSFEYSQYPPTAFHLAVGAHSHVLQGFTDSELRRSGRMTWRQRRRRAQLEARLGHPDPRSTEREVATLLGIVAAVPQTLELHSDEHRQSAAERLAVLMVQRNHIKWVSERRRRDTPAMRLGLCQRPRPLREALRERLFPARCALPPRWARYYWREVTSRAIPHPTRHHLRYAA